MAELDEASKSLGTGAGSAFQNNDQLGAVRLLSQRNFDAIQYSTEANNLSLDVSHQILPLCFVTFVSLWINLGRFMHTLQNKELRYFLRPIKASSIIFGSSAMQLWENYYIENCIFTLKWRLSTVLFVMWLHMRLIWFFIILKPHFMTGCIQSIRATWGHRYRWLFSPQSWSYHSISCWWSKKRSRRWRQRNIEKVLFIFFTFRHSSHQSFYLCDTSVCQYFVHIITPLPLIMIKWQYRSW